MCIQSSFCYQQWIDSWRSRFEQKTDSILLAHWSKRWKSQRLWIYWLLCTTSSAIRAQCMEEAPRRGILIWYWSFDQEGLTFCQTRSNAIILQGTFQANHVFPAHYISKVERLKTGEVMYERPYLFPRPPPKISLKHDHNWTRGNDQLGSTVEQQPVGKFVQQSFGETQRVKLSKPTQSKPNPICDRSEKTVNVFLRRKEKRPIHKRSMMINVCIKNLALQIEQGNLWICLKMFASSMLTMEQGTCEIERKNKKWKEFVPAALRDNASFNANNEFNRATDEENIAFNIPGVPNSTVKRSHGVNVHNLIQKIENHPQRQALQSDFQQHRAFNTFRRESQDSIKVVWNIEICEIVDAELKAQCRACLTFWDVGIVYCTCGHFLKDDTTANKRSLVVSDTFHWLKLSLSLHFIPSSYMCVSLCFHFPLFLLRPELHRPLPLLLPHAPRAAHWAR